MYRGPCRDPRIFLFFVGRLTLAIIAEAHLGLAKANRVLALGDAIKGLELGLVDALELWLAGRSERIAKVAVGCIGERRRAGRSRQTGACLAGRLPGHVAAGMAAMVEGQSRHTWLGK